MKIDCLIGIDPGKSNGGIAVWRPNHNLKTVRMPATMKDLSEFLRYYTSICNPLVILERVTVRPDDVEVDEYGNKKMGKLIRIQQMLANFESLKTTLEVLDIPFAMVHPIKWQDDLKLRIKSKKTKEEKSERKRRYRDISGRLYPELTPTLWNADATLLVHWGRYILQNNPDWVLQNVPNKLHNRIF